MADKRKTNSEKKQKSQAEDTEFFSYFQFCLRLCPLRLHYIFQS